MSAKKAPAMTYVNSILEPGEKVRYQTTVSWTTYMAAILLAICALGACPSSRIFEASIL